MLDLLGYYQLKVALISYAEYGGAFLPYCKRFQNSFSSDSNGACEDSISKLNYNIMLSSKQMLSP